MFNINFWAYIQPIIHLRETKSTQKENVGENLNKALEANKI